MSHQTNLDKRHPNSKVGDTLYRVRWVGYDSKEDTWEPLPKLTRSHVIIYHEKRNIPLPKNINASIEDADSETRNASNAEINNQTAAQLENTRRINDVIEKIQNHSFDNCLLYTSPSPRDQRGSRMPSSA